MLSMQHSSKLSKRREPGMRKRFLQSLQPHLEALILKRKNGQLLVFEHLHHLKHSVQTMNVERENAGAIQLPTILSLILLKQAPTITKTWNKQDLPIYKQQLDLKIDGIESVESRQNEKIVNTKQQHGF